MQSEAIAACEVIMMDDDDMTENDVAYCPQCDEEYWLPEDTEKCPTCHSDDLTFVF